MMNYASATGELDTDCVSIQARALKEEPVMTVSRRIRMTVPRPASTGCRPEAAPTYRSQNSGTGGWGLAMVANRMLSLALLCLGFVAGCKTTAKFDNPVFGPPPRRVSLDENTPASDDIAASDDQSRAGEAGTGRSVADSPGATVQLASNSDVSTAPEQDIFYAQVVARVDGAPVFAGEVLERYGEYLNKVRPQATPEQYQSVREGLIRRDLRSHIERRLLAEKLRSKFKPDQIKQVNQLLEKQFEKEVDRLKRDLKVNTRTELELALQERGTTLATVRDGFIAQQMAMEFLRSQIETPAAPTRTELLAYYREHEADYFHPAEATWDHLQVSFNDAGGREAARAKLREALAQLKAGQSFSDVAMKYSDGPTASKGGRWGWTKRGSLADKEVDEPLFELEIGTFSTPIETRQAVHVVRVVERKAAGRTPFEEVQDEIQQAIQERFIQQGPKETLDRLMAEAIIETDYDIGLPSQVADQPAAGSATR